MCNNIISMTCSETEARFGRVRRRGRRHWHSVRRTKKLLDYTQHIMWVGMYLRVRYNLYNPTGVQKCKFFILTIYKKKTSFEYR